MPERSQRQQGEDEDWRAEGKGFEPSFPSRGNRLSRTARRTVSDYLPFEWTHRESNPGLRPAEPVSFRWTMGPSFFDCAQWTAGESNPDLRRAMPASSRWTSSPVEKKNWSGNRIPMLRVPSRERIRPSRSHKGPPENRTRSPSLPKRCAAGTPADRPAESRPGRTRTCAILCVRQASWPLDDGTNGGQ
jgi:hypothetical protein